MNGVAICKSVLRPLLVRTSESRFPGPSSGTVAIGCLKVVAFVNDSVGDQVAGPNRSCAGVIARLGSVIEPLPSLTVCRRVAPMFTVPQRKRRVKFASLLICCVLRSGSTELFCSTRESLT